MARAYMKDAKVLILDEPTSALDARAETETFNRFIKLTKGKTSVIISHRFSTVRIADRIMVLKDGGILEVGTHEELIKNNSLYSELFNLQAAGYQ
jgi:ATP-binding cassette subfamily B protein